MLIRPFYGIILGAWAFGYFSKHISYPLSPYGDKLVAEHLAKRLRGKFSIFRMPKEPFKFYGLCWKRKFFGKKVRTGWTFEEKRQALTEMAQCDAKYQSALLKLDGIKGDNARALAALHKDERAALEDFLSGKLILTRSTPVPGICYQADPSKLTKRDRKSRAKEQMLFAQIEHELRKPRNLKLFELACARFGRDVVLENWPRFTVRAKWEEMFEDQLPSPEDARFWPAGGPGKDTTSPFLTEGEISPPLSQAAKAHEYATQVAELRYLADLSKQAFPKGMPEE